MSEGRYTVEQMTREQLAEAIGGPLEAADVMLASLKVTGGDLAKLAELQRRTRFDDAPGAKTDGYAIVFDMPDGRSAGLELQLFGCAALKVRRPAPLELELDVYEFCTRAAAVGSGFALALGGEPAGWCRADRLCCAKRETRPGSCGRGEDCRFHGHRPEWERDR